MTEAPEICDGNCPSSCHDGNACTDDILTGSPETCDAVCIFSDKRSDDCTSLDGCCPAGCAATGDLDCPGMRPGVLLVIAKEYFDEEKVRSRIDRYKADHPEHEFREIVIEESQDSVLSMKDRGSEIKRNWVEVRNSIRDLQGEWPQLTGVWLIADAMPLIWRDESLFAITPSAYKASIYPLVATADDYYESYDPVVGGFTEIEGVTTGRGRGDGYMADLWGAALVPVPGWGDAVGQLVEFFDRNHAYLVDPPETRTLLYSDTFGNTSQLLQRIDATGYFSAQDTIFLAPNSAPALSDFSSYYLVMVHKQGEGFVPAGSGGCLMADGQEQLDELNDWLARTWFADQGEFRKIGDDRCYFFSLFIRERSLPLETIRHTLAASLPALACATGDCTVWVADTYFADSDGITVDGHWNNFPAQRAAFETLYSETLGSGDVLYSFITTHGAPDFHYFGITSSVVHDSSFSALVYELQACSTADLVESEVNIAGSYLFFGNAQAVSGYAQPSLLQCEEGNCFDYMHFLQVTPGSLLIDALFDRDYSMHIYFGDPLLVLPQ